MSVFSVHLLRSSFARLGQGLARTARTRRGQSSGNWRRLSRSTSPTWWSGSRWRFSSTRAANLTPKSASQPAPQPASQADYLLHGQNRPQWGTRPRVPGTEFWQRSVTCNGVPNQALRRQYTFVGYVCMYGTPKFLGSLKIPSYSGITHRDLRLMS